MAVLTKKDPFEGLSRANAMEAYDWLVAHSPAHFDAVQQAVEGGSTPDEIYRFMLRDTFRPEIAHRCRLAARWMTIQAGQAA
jgi:hypothetical protein